MLHVQLHNMREPVKLMSCDVKRRSFIFKLCCHIYPEIGSFTLTLLVANAVSQLDSDKEQVDVTKLNDTLCKEKANTNSFILKCRFVCKFSESCGLLHQRTGILVSPSHSITVLLF